MSSDPERTAQIVSIYAIKGDVDGLYSFIHDQPNHFSKFLQDINKLQFVNTPLHEAAAQGQTLFAVEILNLIPALGRKLSPDGLSPLHVALKENKLDTARALVRIDRELVRVKGRDGCTPLHYAVKMNTDLDIMAGFLMDCPDSIEDLNSRFQNVVHVAIETNNCEAIMLLLNWLARRAKEPVLGWRDDKGNTALHVAVQYDCIQGVKRMVGIAKLNKRNLDGKTALDIAEDLHKIEMANVLRNAGARRSHHLPTKQTLSEYLLTQVTFLENMLRGYYFMLKDLTNEMRNVVLVVAVLIATATYQAVLQPPGGVYQGEIDKSAVGRIALEVASKTKIIKHLPGKMVMSKPAYNQFMPANTAAFTLSTVMIIFILHGRPYNLILHMCLIFLAYSYLIAMSFISDSDRISDIMFFLSWFVIAATFLSKMLYYVAKSLLVDNVWWMPRFSVISSNVSYSVAQGQLGHKTISRARNLRRQYKLIRRDLSL